MGGSSRRLHPLHMVLHMLHMLGVNGTYAAVVEASSIYGLPVCFAHSFVRMQGRNTKVQAEHYYLYRSQNVACLGLFRSPINMAIDSSRPPASLPPIGRHAERTPLSLSRVCMFVCGYVRVAHRDGALYLCTRSRSKADCLSDACRRACLCPRLSCLASKQAS